MFEVIVMAAIFGILFACVCTGMCNKQIEAIQADEVLLDEEF